MSNNIAAYAALSTNPLIGPRRFEKIIEAFPLLDDFLALKPESQAEFCGSKNPDMLPVFASMRKRGDSVVLTCKQKNIKIIALESPEYSPRFKNIPDAPYVYYQLGDMNHSTKLVGIVGTRHPSADSIAVNEYFSRELVSYNIGIVSGLAKGHDAISQQTVIDCGGYTVGVLGSGIDVVYPKEIHPLYDAIRIEGAIISEYIPGTPPLKPHFPLRNRLISALSDAVLLIQAPEKSGALITLKYAEDQGRDIYVIPGNPTDEKYSGSNKAIQNGAKLALKPEDIVIDLLGKSARKNVIRDAEFDLSPVEKKVLAHLTRSTFIDELSDRAGIALTELNHILTLLEIKGIVNQYPGRFYEKKSI